MFPAMIVELGMKTSVSWGQLLAMLAMRLSGFVASPESASAYAEDEHDQTGHAQLHLGIHDAL